MGFFGGEKIYVSSVVYNLAGDINKRPNFLKSAVVGAVVGEKDSIPETVANAYRGGPGLRLLNFARWGRNSNYDSEIGLTKGTIGAGISVDPSLIESQLPMQGSTPPKVKWAMIDHVDFTYWVDRWLMQNNYPIDKQDFASDIDPLTQVITITNTGNNTVIARFTPDNFDPEGLYLYVLYNYDTTSTSAFFATPPQVFIYKMGSGNATLDGLFTDLNIPENTGTFFPFIPIRIDNKFVSERYPDTIYPDAKKAFTKATGSNYDDLQTAIKSNKSIGDIDYAYIVFGVSLNTKENACKKYLYHFFKSLMGVGEVTADGFQTYQQEWQAQQPVYNTWIAWYNGGRVGPEPPAPNLPQMPTNKISVNSAENGIMNYNMTISWNGIYEETGNGLLKSDAKVGEVWLNTTTPSTENVLKILFNTAKQPAFIGDPTNPFGVTTISWQVDADNWKRLTIAGLVHRNLIYKGHAVVTYAGDALADADESGFIIPLQEDIYKSMGIKEYTQMSTACAYIVFNCYKVVKTHWYQTGFFQFILIIVVVVISVLTFGAGAATAPGLLGSNAALGVAVTGAATSAMMAAIIGAIINTIAAVVLVSIITKISTAIFGEKLGAIIGCIASFVTLQVANGLQNGLNFSAIFSNLTSAINLINLTFAVGSGISGYINAATQDIMGEISSYQEQENAQSLDIQNQALQNLGYGNGIVDPFELVGSLTSSSTGSNSVFLTEPSEIFLSRTLMTGSDIAELSMSMIHNFAKLTLNTELLFSH